VGLVDLQKKGVGRVGLEGSSFWPSGCGLQVLSFQKKPGFIMKSSQPFHAGCIIVSVEVLRLRELDDYQLEAFPKLEEGRRD
jgi:hypothetical protein